MLEGNYMLKALFILLVPFLIVACISILIYLIYRILRNPFQYPYFLRTFDVTSKRNIKIEDYIDNFLRNEENWQLIQSHEKHIQQWKHETENDIRSGRLQKYRMKQYEQVLDDDHAYQFQTIRQQTRYRQVDYVKTPYKVSVVDLELSTSWNWLSNRYKRLEIIGFEATLNDYNHKSQRKLMTPALRKQIMERDHYTCQLCGKYMPDEVGLHIDHIVPIAKDGKSIPSNLRVLCSKCNGSKGAK